MGGERRTLAGLANVASLTFLVGRVVPLGWTVVIVGGVPLARAGQRHGVRAGYATAGASLVETMAIMGPARMGIPVPHALSAPLLGVLEGRGRGFAALAAAGSAVRFGWYAVTSTFSILLIVGLDAYLGTYERVRGVLDFLPAGRTPALWITATWLLVWSIGAGLIQAWVVRRALRRWPVAPDPEPDGDRRAPDAREAAPRHAGRTTLVAIAGIVATLATTDPRVLGAVAAGLAIAWIASRAGARAVVNGVLLGVPLAATTLAFGLVGGIGTALALRRGARVLLLVLIAVWLRAAAQSEGLRAVSMRAMHRMRRVPTLALATAILGASAGAGDYRGAARRLGHLLRAAPKRPAPIVDTTLAWVAQESRRPADG